MATSSLEELRGRIAAGEYAVDSGELARDILSKFALIRRVRRRLLGDADEGAVGEAGGGAQRRDRRQPRSASVPPAQRNGERRS